MEALRTQHVRLDGLIGHVLYVAQQYTVEKVGRVGCEVLFQS